MDDGLDIIDADEDVLWFEICVNDTAAAVHVVEAEEDLLRDLADKWHGDTLVLVTLDEPEKVFAEDLEDHTYVGAVWAFVSKVVEK